LNNLKFGDKVEITEKYFTYNKFSIDKCPFKTWDKEKISVTGIFLGYRNLKEGYLLADSEYGRYFNTVNVIKACLVAYDSIHNPIYVPVDSIQLKREEDSIE